MDPMTKLTHEELTSCHGDSDGALLVRLSHLSMLNKKLLQTKAETLNWVKFEKYCSKIGANWFTRYIYDPVKKVVQGGLALFTKIGSMITFLTRQAQEFALGVWTKISDWLSRIYYHVGLAIPDAGEFSSGTLGIIAGTLTFIKNLSGCETTADLVSLLTVESKLFKSFGKLWDTLIQACRVYFRSSGSDSVTTHAGEFLDYKPKTYEGYLKSDDLYPEIKKFGDNDYESISQKYQLKKESSTGYTDLERISVPLGESPDTDSGGKHRNYAKESSQFGNEPDLLHSRLRQVLGSLLGGEINTEFMISLDFSVLKSYLSSLMSFITKICVWLLDTLKTAFSRTFELLGDVFSSLISPGNAAERKVIETLMPVSVYIGSISSKISQKVDSSAKISAKHSAQAMASVVGRLVTFCARISQTEELLSFLEWKGFSKLHQKIVEQQNQSLPPLPPLPPDDTFQFFLWMVEIIKEKNASESELEPWKEAVLDLTISELQAPETWESQESSEFEDFEDLTYWLEFSGVKRSHLKFLRSINENLLQKIQSTYGWISCIVGFVSDGSGNIVNGSKTVASSVLDSIDKSTGASRKISGLVDLTHRGTKVIINSVSKISTTVTKYFKNRRQFWKILWNCVLWAWKIVKWPVALQLSSQVLESFTGISIPAEAITFVSSFSLPVSLEFVRCIQTLYYKLSNNMAQYFNHFQNVVSASFVKTVLGNTQPDMSENLSTTAASESSNWVKTFDSLKETTFHVARINPLLAPRIISQFKRYEEAVRQLSSKLEDWKGTKALLPSYKFSKQLALAVVESRYSSDFRSYFRIHNFKKLSDGFLDHLETEGISELFVAVEKEKSQLTELLQKSSQTPKEIPQKFLQAKEQGNIISEVSKLFNEAYSLERVVRKLSGDLEVATDLSKLVVEYESILSLLETIRDRLIVGISGGNYVSRGLDLLGLEVLSDGIHRRTALKQASNKLDAMLSESKTTRSEYIKQVFGGTYLFIPDVEYQRFLNELSKISSRLEIVLRGLGSNKEDYLQARDTMRTNMESMLDAQNNLKSIREQASSKITVKIVDLNPTATNELETLRKRFFDILKTSNREVERQLQKMESIAKDIDSATRDLGYINEQLRVSYLKKEFSSIGIVDIMSYMASASVTFSFAYYMGSSVLRSCANVSSLATIVNATRSQTKSSDALSEYLSGIVLPYELFTGSRSTRSSTEAWVKLFTNGIQIPGKNHPKSNGIGAKYPISESPWSVKKICCFPGSNIPISLSVESGERIQVISSSIPSEKLQIACKSIWIGNDAKKVYSELLKTYSMRDSLFNQSIDTFLMAELYRTTNSIPEKRHSLVKLEFGLLNDPNSILQRSSALSEGRANSLLVSVNGKYSKLLEWIMTRCHLFLDTLSTDRPNQFWGTILGQVGDWKNNVRESDIVDNFFQMLTSFVFLGGGDYRTQNRLEKTVSQILTTESRDIYALISLPRSNAYHWDFLVNSITKHQYSNSTEQLVLDDFLVEKLGMVLFCAFDMLLKQISLELRLLSTHSTDLMLADLEIFYPTLDTIQHFGENAAASESVSEIIFEELWGLGTKVVSSVGLDLIVGAGSFLDGTTEWLMTSAVWNAYKIPALGYFIDWLAGFGPPADSEGLITNIMWISKISTAIGVSMWLSKVFVGTMGFFNDSWITDGKISHAMRIITNRTKSIEKSRTEPGTWLGWGHSIMYYGSLVFRIPLTCIETLYNLVLMFPVVGHLTKAVVSLVKFFIGISVPIYLIRKVLQRVNVTDIIGHYVGLLGTKIGETVGSSISSIIGGSSATTQAIQTTSDSVNGVEALTEDQVKNMTYFFTGSDKKVPNNQPPEQQSEFSHGPTQMEQQINNVESTSSTQTDQLNPQLITLDQFAEDFVNFSKLMLGRVPKQDETILSKHAISALASLLENTDIFDDRKLSIEELYALTGLTPEYELKYEASNQAIDFVFLLYPYYELMKKTNNTLVRNLIDLPSEQLLAIRTSVSDLKITIDNEYLESFGDHVEFKESLDLSYYTNIETTLRDQKVVKIPGPAKSGAQFSHNQTELHPIRKPKITKTKPIDDSVKLLTVDVSYALVDTRDPPRISYEIFRNCLEISHQMFSLLVDDKPYSRIVLFTVFSETPVFCFPDPIDYTFPGQQTIASLGPDFAHLPENLLPDLHLRNCLRLITGDLKDDKGTALALAKEAIRKMAEILWNDVKLDMQQMYTDDIETLFKISWFMVFRDAEKLAERYNRYLDPSDKPDNTTRRTVATFELDADEKVLLKRRKEAERLLMLKAPQIRESISTLEIPQEISQKLGLHRSTFFYS